MDLAEKDFKAPEKNMKFSAEKVYVVSILFFVVIFFGGLVFYLSQNKDIKPDKIPEPSTESSLLGVFNQSEVSPEPSVQVSQEPSGPLKPPLKRSPSPSNSLSPTPSPTPSSSESSSPIPVASPSPTPSESPSPTPTASP